MRMGVQVSPLVIGENIMGKKKAKREKADRREYERLKKKYGEKTLAMIDHSVKNLKKGIVGAPIDLGD